MLVVMQPVVEFDVVQMLEDLAAKGWQPADLALRADVSKSTVSRFLAGQFQTPRTGKKLATALGYSLRRYLRPIRATA